MTEPPVIDERDQAALLDDLTDLTDNYVDGWEPDSADEATVLLRIASEFGADLISRLNRLPAKHRSAFLDTIGFERRPPQAARLPLSVEVSTDLGRNVTIPGGTQAVAATDDDEIRFEIPQDHGFEATSASLTELYAVDPATNRITDHQSATDGDSETLFVGDNSQQHALYFGDDALLTLDPGSVIDIDLDGDIDSETLDEQAVWEYYGVDGNGTEGWHRLPTADQSKPLFSSAGDSISQRFDQLSMPTEASTADTERAYSVSRQLPHDLVSTTVDGIESKWLRCRLAEPTTTCFATKIESVRVEVGQSTGTSETTPDTVIANDVPLSLDDDSELRPFGRLPQPSSTLYLAAAEALTKLGAEITLTFHSLLDAESADHESGSEPSTDVNFGALSGPPEISWEYWNGNGWLRLDISTDETDGFRTAGEIVFDVPDDIEKTAVSGHEHRWIRVRLVSGNYGQPSVEVTDAGTRGDVTTPQPPRFSRISLTYEHTDSSFAHVVAQNNAVYEPVDTTSRDSYTPFKRLPEENQTIYFGFDDVLRNGPIPIFLPVAETGYPQGFDPGIQWEYCTDPETDTWSTLAVEDGTADLTDRGIVSLSFPESTTADDRFGIRCHWIRAVVTEDPFVTEKSVGADRWGGESARSPAGGSTASVAEPPVVEGIYPNTQWADNARTVENEILGSSDGSPDQTFQCAHGPVIDCEVWVDEVGRLSAADREELRADNPDRIDVITDQQGDITSFWVRWTAVDDVLGATHADSDGRHYHLDRSTGTVTFGDGDAGMIPPRGQDTIRATYTTGGGVAGNVEAGAITDLKTPISLVESVDNPLSADGGAAAEPTEAVGSRAAGRIKTRGRAVTATDYEQVAMTAVRKLAAVDCQPHRGPDGNRKQGCLTLLIVPEADRERPTPSMELETRVRQAVSEAAPATLTAGDDSRIVVRGPTYAVVSVDATVRTTGVESISVVKAAIESTLSAYLHPTDGGPEGTGWAFGELPTVESLQSQLRSVAGVDTVTELSATVSVGDDEFTLAQGPSQPTLPVDGLVCNGEHDTTVEVGDRI